MDLAQDKLLIKFINQNIHERENLLNPEAENSKIYLAVQKYMGASILCSHVGQL